MDGPRFDDLMRVLAETGSRRRLVTRLLGGTSLVALLGSGPFESPAAARNKKKRRKRKKKNDPCQGKPAISNERCPNTPENLCKKPPSATEACLCARGADGQSTTCVNLAGEQCPTTDQCDTADDCPGDEVCIQLGSCCEGSPNNLCVLPC